MEFVRYIERIERLDSLIRRKGTGSPRECAGRLGISERALYETLNDLKDMFSSPIEYCKERKSYYYVSPGHISVQFMEEELALKRRQA